jgi:hypothetical protein
LPAKAASLALQCVLPRSILDVSTGFTSLAPVGGTKKTSTEAAWNTSASAGAYKACAPFSKIVAGVYAGCARALGIPLARFIVRKPHGECKYFCASSGMAPSSGLRPGALCASKP